MAYGGVEIREVINLIEDIESELKLLTEHDIGKREGLWFSYKRLMEMLYEQEYCDRKYKELNVV